MIATILLITALVVVLVRRRPVTEYDDSEDDETSAETVVAAMSAGQAAVRDQTIQDPRQAIVACFAAMERLLAGLGSDVAPRQADTAEEVLRRGISGAQLPAAPATSLLHLFREARYSSHRMRQTDREQADQALVESLDSLDRTRQRSDGRASMAELSRTLRD